MALFKNIILAEESYFHSVNKDDLEGVVSDVYQIKNYKQYEEMHDRLKVHTTF